MRPLRFSSAAATSVPNIEDVRKWLEAPLVGGGGISGSIAGFGASSPSAKIANTSQGFAVSGFAETVQGWLEGIFPSPQVGAFIGVIDNLELLETSKAARDQLESLRDKLFAIRGMRWVLCGARGIVRSVASSSRLQGVLAEPIEVLPIPDEHVSSVIERRLKVFGTGDSYLPVEGRGFRHLYDVSNRTLRTAMKFSEDYSMWLERQDRYPKTAQDKLDLLEVWMAETADKYEADSVSVRGNRAWEVFDGIANDGGSISPGDFSVFGFESYPAMRPHIKALEEARLLDSAVDENDRRRKTIEISARGWIVHYKRAGYRTPAPAAADE